LGGLTPLLARADSRELNYWETFEVYYIVGEANRIRRDDAKARTALEQCLAFTDIEPQRRRKALVAIGKVYERQKDADAALDVYAELNNMRGGKYPKMLMAIADVHMTIFGDRAAAIPYLEAAIEHASGAPNRAHYLKLRRAYHQHGDRQSALNVANAMVDLFDNPADEEAVDDIVSAMNRRVP
jgi:tetratricopeptide (TPR) repeat protein